MVLVTLFNEREVATWCAQHGYAVRRTSGVARTWQAQSEHHTVAFAIGDTLIFQSARILVHHPRD